MTGPRPPDFQARPAQTALQRHPQVEAQLGLFLAHIAPLLISESLRISPVSNEQISKCLLSTHKRQVLKDKTDPLINFNTCDWLGKKAI